jgi:uncharacterized spore protein YtfJ
VSASTDGPTAEQQQTLDVMKRILEIKRMVTEGAAGGNTGQQQPQQQQQQQPPGGGAGRCVSGVSDLWLILYVLIVAHEALTRNASVVGDY